MTAPMPSVALAGTVKVRGGRAETLKVLLVPACPLPSLAYRHMPVCGLRNRHVAGPRPVGKRRGGRA